LSPETTILAIETSCDDTCAAVIDGAGTMLANVISSQHVHDRFGGVVPEIASRHHLMQINTVLDAALERAQLSLGEIDLVAATQGPGLIGALLVGLSTGKALAAARKLPFAPIDHLQGHVAANYLSLPELAPFDPPFLCLIASGGHTLLAEVRSADRFGVLGSTLDDAAGEAFDKGARLLGLGFPGGPALERLAQSGDPQAFELPIAGRRVKGAGRAGAQAGQPPGFAHTLDFSFAGIKTALAQRVRALGAEELERRRADLAASFQHAIIESLLGRIHQALERTGLERLAVGGGVAANGALRSRLEALPVSVHIPPRELCTDNAAMIASAARFVRPLRYPDYLSLDAYAAGEGLCPSSGR
jgi:N6-L-threonylcarbamoyladenine synthase